MEHSNKNEDGSYDNSIWMLGYAIPIQNNWQYLHKDKYEIIEETPNQILICDDSGVNAFYYKEYFRLYQG